MGGRCDCSQTSRLSLKTQFSPVPSNTHARWLQEAAFPLEMPWEHVLQMAPFLRKRAGDFCLSAEGLAGELPENGAVSLHV